MLASYLGRRVRERVASPPPPRRRSALAHCAATTTHSVPETATPPSSLTPEPSNVQRPAARQRGGAAQRGARVVPRQHARTRPRQGQGAQGGGDARARQHLLPGGRAHGPGQSCVSCVCVCVLVHKASAFCARAHVASTPQRLSPCSLSLPPSLPPSPVHFRRANSRLMMIE